MENGNFIDLSHIIEEDISSFKSLPKPEISTYFTHEESKKFYKKCTFEVTMVKFQTSIGKRNLQHISSNGFKGTYMDSPYHRHPQKDDISMLQLQDTILPGILVDVTHKKFQEAIDLNDLPESVRKNVSLKGKAVLFYTGFDQFWKKDEYHKSPFLAKDVVKFLVSKEVKLVGIDVINIDDGNDEERPAHTLLLEKDILIVENLCNLGKLKGKKDFTFFACPLKVKKAASFPVRSFAFVKEITSN